MPDPPRQRDGHGWRGHPQSARAVALPCSVSAQYLEEAYQRAVATPSFETTFKNLHLNLWTDSAETWLGSQSWADCRGELPSLDGRECFAALVLGATDDLTALGYAFPIDGKLYLQCRTWCATATVREAKRSYQSQYRNWADRGWLTLTPGKQTDYDEIIRTLAADAERYRIVQVGYDQWNAADLAQKLQDHYGLELVKIPQSCAGLNMGTRTVEEAVAIRSLVHDGNPILAWAVGSASVVSDSSGNRKLNKRDTAGKIDPAVAMVHWTCWRCSERRAASDN